MTATPTTRNDLVLSFARESSLVAVPPLGLSQISPAPHSPVLVRPSWGLTHESPGPAIIAPTTPGPDPSATTNPGPVITPIALSPPGPDRQVSFPQCPLGLQLGMAALAHGVATDPLVDIASSTVEQITQAADLLTYIRSAQQLTVAAPP